jgi:hypothetical protein
MDLASRYLRELGNGARRPSRNGRNGQHTLCRRRMEVATERRSGRTPGVESGRKYSAICAHVPGLENRLSERPAGPVKRLAGPSR